MESRRGEGGGRYRAAEEIEVIKIQIWEVEIYVSQIFWRSRALEIKGVAREKGVVQFGPKICQKLPLGKFI